MKRELHLPNVADLETRIVQHFRHIASDQERHEATVAWHGYIAALGEWQMLSIQDADRLRDLLPPYDSEPNQITEIMLGHDEDIRWGSDE